MGSRSAGGGGSVAWPIVASVSSTAQHAQTSTAQHTCFFANHSCSSEISRCCPSPSACGAARSTKPCSSRTLPGNAYDSRRRTAGDQAEAGFSQVTRGLLMHTPGCISVGCLCLPPTTTTHPPRAPDEAPTCAWREGDAAQAALAAEAPQVVVNNRGYVRRTHAQRQHLRAAGEAGRGGGAGCEADGELR